MSQVQMKEPFLMVVTDGLKTRFYHSEHLKNGRFKTISALSDEGSQTLPILEIIENIENDDRNQIVFVAPPKALKKLKEFFTEQIAEREICHLSRNMVRKTTDQILNYLQNKDKFQLVKKEQVAS